MFKTRFIIIAMISVLAFGVYYYRQSFLQEKTEKDYILQENITLKNDNTRLREQIETTSNIDHELTRELNNAKDEINNLRLNLSLSHRVYIAADCSSVSDTSATASMDNATTAELT